MLVIATAVFSQEDGSVKNVVTPYHRMQPSAPGVVLRWLLHSGKKGKIEARPSMGRYLHSPGVGNLGPAPVCHQICLRTRQFLRPRQKPVAQGIQVLIHRHLTLRGRSRQVPQASTPTGVATHTTGTATNRRQLYIPRLNSVKNTNFGLYNKKSFLTHPNIVFGVTDHFCIK